MSAWYIAIVVTVGFVLFLRKAWHNYTRLPRVPYVSGLPMPSVTVIIPAGNDEANIARALSGFPPEQVIVVDSGSGDRTSVIAEEAGVKVVKAPPSATGGKANAWMAGAQASDSEWILLLDANAWCGRVFLPCVIAFAEDNEVHSLSVFLQLECETLAEKALLPYAKALYFTGVNARTVNARRPSQWLASEHCLLIRRDAYFRLGGHAAVADADAAIEDLALAKLAAERGQRILVARAEHMGSVRAFGGFSAIREVMRESWFRRLRMNPFSSLQVTMAAILLTCWLPVVLLLLAGHAYRQAALMALIPSVILFPWYRSTAALMAPIAIYVVHAMALESVFATVFGRKTR